MTTKKGPSKDLPPKKPTAVKGGRISDYAGNDNITLVRGVKCRKH